MSTAIGLSPGAQAGASARRPPDLKAGEPGGEGRDRFGLCLAMREGEPKAGGEEEALSAVGTVAASPVQGLARPGLAASLAARAATVVVDAGGVDPSTGPGVLRSSPKTQSLCPIADSGRSEGAVGAVAPAQPEVRVLAAETHLGPVSRSVAQQVFARLQVQLDCMRTEGAPDSNCKPTATSCAMPAAEPLRVLRLELRPSDLGVVNVTMRLVGGRLEIVLEASRADTARWLGEQSGSLSALLRGAGFEAAGVEVRAGGQAEGPRGRRNPEERQGVRRGERHDDADRDRGVVYL